MSRKLVNWKGSQDNPCLVNTANRRICIHLYKTCKAHVFFPTPSDFSGIIVMITDHTESIFLIFK